jgi:hypothetical protein
MAEPGDNGSTETASKPDTGTITGGAIGPGARKEFRGGRQAANAVFPRPACTYTRYSPPVDTSGRPVGPNRGGAIEQLLEQAAMKNASLYRKECPYFSGTLSTLALVPNVVNVRDLIASAASRVTAQLPHPSVNMNPVPSVGGVVNIGLWLAVQDPGHVSITASVGPVWATVTARYQRTVWDLGNGDTVECQGLGTPIVNVNTADQGPCGYTYRWPSAPKFTGTDDLAYHTSVTGHWVITYATSTGSRGSLAPIARTTSFTYRVREIQTVRVGAGG